MNKRVLIIYYTQSGQLEEIVNNFAIPFENSGIVVEKLRVNVKEEFVFPWNSKSFFQAMPESVLGIPAQLVDFKLKESKYDLVVIAYQPWFLSPSIPANSVLHHPTIKKTIRNTPVVTLIGARNMWLNSQETVKKSLKETEAKLVGNAAFVDRNHNLLSAVSIVYWMLWGKKERLFNVFPKPGINETDIGSAKKIGELVKNSLEKGDLNTLQKSLVEIKAIEVKPNLMFIEKMGKRVFNIWANIIIKKKNRNLWLSMFKYYLIFALFIFAPIATTINSVFFRPFFKKRLQRQKNYYLGIS